MPQCRSAKVVNLSTGECWWWWCCRSSPWAWRIPDGRPSFWSQFTTGPLWVAFERNRCSVFGWWRITFPCEVFELSCGNDNWIQWYGHSRTCDGCCHSGHTQSMSQGFPNTNRPLSQAYQHRCSVGFKLWASWGRWRWSVFSLYMYYYTILPLLITEKHQIHPANPDWTYQIWLNLTTLDRMWLDSKLYKMWSTRLVTRHSSLWLWGDGDQHSNMSPELSLLHACDKADISFSFIKSHKNRPKHLRNDIFARLSQGALNDIDEADKNAIAALTAITLAEYHPADGQSKVDSKKAKDELGDRLLEQYMQILGRPGSILSKSCCTLALTL